MGKVMQLLVQLCALLVAASGIYLVGYVALGVMLSLRQGYTWQEMDWSQKGSTSMSDFFAAADIGKREVVAGGKTCIDYFAYKDGQTVKMVCPKP